MSHRRQIQRRRERESRSKQVYRPGLFMRLMAWSARSIKEQARWMLMFSGAAWLSQLYLFPHYPDVVFFGAAGGAMLGLSMKGALWR